MNDNMTDLLPWHSIVELTDRYQGELLLRAPELVDLDCNVDGVGMGYWQDGAGTSEASKRNKGAWMAAKWSMTNDEWYEKECNPTHFIKLGGPMPYKFDFHFRAVPNEPTFTMLARDPEFYYFLMKWAEQREIAVMCGDRPDEDIEQVQVARELAERGKRWRRENNGRWRKEP